MRALGLVLATLGASGVAGAQERLLDRVDTAIYGAARWLESCAIETEAGLRWPADPKRPKRRDRSLYSGSPGVVLFFALLSTAETDANARQRWARLALRGAAQLKVDAADPEWKSAGLYTGLAGTGYVLHEVGLRLGSHELMAAANDVVTRLGELAKRTAHGVRWDASNDIISGGAGIGLFLTQMLEYHSYPFGSEADRKKCRSLVDACAAELAAQADRSSAGSTWPMSVGAKRRMPNFSHGTAGIAFFLERYAQFAWAKRRAEMHGLAVAGAQSLIARADLANGCRISHHIPGGERLYYLGWCHGPVGTARLFQLLEHASGSGGWYEWVRASSRALLDSGIPERRTPGFWQNAGTCCGTAGVLDYVLDQRSTLPDERAAHRDFTLRLVRDILERATVDESGTRWVSAEHRVRPKLLVAQTGFMQGASGIGIRLLEWRQQERGKSLDFYMPDDLRPGELEAPSGRSSMLISFGQARFPKFDEPRRLPVVSR